jgi:ABC-type branched-subunit amino acid transport system ATPase component
MLAVARALMAAPASPDANAGRTMKGVAPRVVNQILTTVLRLAELGGSIRLVEQNVKFRSSRSATSLTSWRTGPARFEAPGPSCWPIRSSRGVPETPASGFPRSRR